MHTTYILDLESYVACGCRLVYPTLWSLLQTYQRHNLIQLFEIEIINMVDKLDSPLEKPLLISAKLRYLRIYANFTRLTDDPTRPLNIESQPT